MTPSPIDADVVRQKLAAIEDSLETLEGLGDVDKTRLRQDRVVAAAVERLISRIVDLAVDINSHVVSAVAGRGPGEYAESFRMAAGVELIDSALSDDLVGSVGMRNVIVHQYVDLDPGLIAAAIPLTLDGYRRYVSSAAAFVLRQDA
ncbi:MAG TPA: DUF86 domain-containing protein [Acidimicrobiia bacterium]|jgi:uncharacterized protein YutE (UPF0331/DUF86 family)|nr:DUF86 domain-containing protein [Acidimicrobiia bacterium]